MAYCKKFILSIGLLTSPSHEDVVLQRNSHGKLALVPKDSLDDHVTPSMSHRAVLGANRNRHTIALYSNSSKK